MRKLFTIGAMLLVGSVFAQTENVGIGTKSPDESAILDLSSNKKGFLLPRMSESQRKNIVKPAQGLQVYQTDEKSGLYIFNGSDWTNAANSVMAASDPWLRGGNAVVDGEFIGTTNNANLEFRVGGTKAGLLSVDNRTFFGLLAGNSTTGAHNTAIGFRALQSNVTGIRNTAIGSRALNVNIADDNLAIGMDALQLNSTGNNNTAIGYGSLNLNQTGSLNMAIGTAALSQQTAGDFNVGIGWGAGYGNSSGSGNIAIGSYSLFSAGTRSNSLAIGFQAGRNATGSNNIFIGNSSGFNETTSNKLYIANSNTDMPLIFGDFSAKYVTIGDVTPALRTQALSMSGGYNLLVKGGILTEKVKVALAVAGTDWADYVFDQEYKSKMMSLEEVEIFTLKNKHLPNVPSAQEMVANGLDVSQTSKMFMEKIEELTLYIIELNKEVKALKANK